MCDARTTRAVLYWCRALEMDGIGEKLVDQLLEHGLVAGLEDLYALSTERLMSLERMGATSAGNVMAQIDASRRMPLGRFLHALGLPGIGPELATAMAQHFGSADAVLPWVERAMAVPGERRLDRRGRARKSVRPTQSHPGPMHDGRRGHRGRSGFPGRREPTTHHRRSLALRPRRDRCIPTGVGGVLEGRSFCLTGTLTMPRKQAQEAIKAAGGRVVGASRKPSTCSLQGPPPAQN
ncbi:MAG: hypothetical protein CM15mP79_1050 [Methanobacteriota archaeon]|nr:MAG: hypothetical protein CM15mP79_1050 [Euryarchaeota archaeon]